MKALLTTALQKILMLDPESKQRLEGLQQKSVTIELLGTGLTFQIQFLDADFRIAFNDFLEPDTTIRGAPFSLLHLAVTKEKRKQFFAEDVSMVGNLDVGQQVIALFDELDIDWEEYLSHWVGDIPAHHVGKVGRGIKQFSQRLRHVLQENINEYVHEEVDLFPPVEALQDFYHDVDVLRMDVDRLAAHLDHLTQLVENKRG